MKLSDKCIDFIEDICELPYRGNRLTVEELLSPPYQIKLIRNTPPVKYFSTRAKKILRSNYRNLFNKESSDIKWCDILRYLEIENKKPTEHTTLQGVINNIQDVKIMVAREKPDATLYNLTGKITVDGVEIISKIDKYKSGVIYKVVEAPMFSVAKHLVPEICNVDIRVFQQLGLRVDGCIPLVPYFTSSGGWLSDFRLTKWNETIADNFIKQRVKYHKEPVQECGCTISERLFTETSIRVVDGNNNIVKYAYTDKDVEDYVKYTQGFRVGKSKKSYHICDAEGNKFFLNKPTVEEVEREIFLRQNLTVKRQPPKFNMCAYGCEVHKVCPKKNYFGTDKTNKTKPVLYDKKKYEKKLIIRKKQ